MSNTLYPKFKKRCATTGGNLVAGTVKAVLIDLAQYTYSANHEFLSDIAAGARVGTHVALTNKTVSDLGVFDADNASFTGLSGAPTLEAVILYVDTGVEATSPLVLIYDTATGLPIGAGAASGTITWDNGSNKIFAL
jgi:hypothetical protein